MTSLDTNWGSMSYNQQYDLLFESNLDTIDTLTSIPKPDKKAQKDEPGASKVFLSDVYSAVGI